MIEPDSAITIEKNRLYFKRREQKLSDWLVKNNGSISGLRSREAKDRVDKTNEDEEIVATRREIKIKEEEYKRVRRFLDLMEKGEYGICENCRKPIPIARLDALPTANLCVPCAS